MSIVIPIVGPSHAGKSTIVEFLSKRENNKLEPTKNINYKDLDIELGEKNRSDWKKAKNIIENYKLSNIADVFIVVVGAGQLQNEESINYFIENNLTIIIWCNESTFKERHKNTWERELFNNYQDKHIKLWNHPQKRLIDTSNIAIPESAEKLVNFINEIIK